MINRTEIKRLEEEKKLLEAQIRCCQDIEIIDLLDTEGVIIGTNHNHHKDIKKLKEKLEKVRQKIENLKVINKK